MDDQESIKKQKYINWKIPFVTGVVLSFAILFLLINLKGYFIGMINNNLFNDIYPIFVILIILNCALATYTITQYYYRIDKPGMKGPPGNFGPRGDRGEDKLCDITSPKIKRFKLKKIPNPEKYAVDVSVLENATLDLENARIIPQWTTSNKIGITDVSGNIIGARGSKCLNDNKCSIKKNISVKENVLNEETGEDEIKRTLKPFNGAILNYSVNKSGTDGDIHTFQFTYDKNNNVKKQSHEIQLLQDFVGPNNLSKELKHGLKTNKGVGTDFSCPPHSAIYKIEALHGNDTKNKAGNIKGLKFHCRDITTGENRKILDENNNKVNEINFGVEVSPSNKSYTYSSVECPNITRKLHDSGKAVKIPGVLSNYDIISGDKTGLQALKFNHCSYYHKNPNEFKLE